MLYLSGIPLGYTVYRLWYTWYTVGIQLMNSWNISELWVEIVISVTDERIIPVPRYTLRSTVQYRYRRYAMNY